MTSYGSCENVPPRPPTTGSTLARGSLLLYFETHGCVGIEAISPMCCSHQVTEGDRALGPFPGAHGIPLLANFGLKAPQWPCHWYWFGILDVSTQLLSLSLLSGSDLHGNLSVPSLCMLPSVLTVSFCFLCSDILTSWDFADFGGNDPPRARSFPEIINTGLRSLPFKCKPTNPWPYTQPPPYWAFTFRATIHLPQSPEGQVPNN